jgi:hypothetical protein
MGELYIFGIATKIIVQDTTSRFGIHLPEDIQKINDRVLHAITSEYTSIRKDYISDSLDVRLLGGARPQGDSRFMKRGTEPPPIGNATDVNTVATLGSASVAEPNLGSAAEPNSSASVAVPKPTGRPFVPHGTQVIINEKVEINKKVKKPSSAQPPPTEPNLGSAEPNMNAFVAANLAAAAARRGPPPPAAVPQLTIMGLPPLHHGTRVNGTYGNSGNEGLLTASGLAPRHVAPRPVYGLGEPVGGPHAEQEAARGHAEAVERLQKRKQAALNKAQEAVDEIMEQLENKALKNGQKSELRSQLEDLTKIRDNAQTALDLVKEHKPSAAVNKTKALGQLADAVDALAEFTNKQTVDGGIQLMYKLALAAQKPDSHLEERQKCVNELAQVLGYVTREVAPVLQEMIDKRKETIPNLQYKDAKEDMKKLEASHKINNDLKNKLTIAFAQVGITVGTAVATGRIGIGAAGTMVAAVTTPAAVAGTAVAGTAVAGTVAAAAGTAAGAVAGTAILSNITPLAKNLLGYILTATPIPTRAELIKEYKTIIDKVICDLLNEKEIRRYGNSLDPQCSINIRPHGPAPILPNFRNQTPNFFQERRYIKDTAKAREQAWERPILAARMEEIGLYKPEKVASAYNNSSNDDSPRAPAPPARAPARAPAPPAPPASAPPPPVGVPGQNSPAKMAAARKAREEAAKAVKAQGHVLGSTGRTRSNIQVKIDQLNSSASVPPRGGSGGYTRKLSKRRIQRGGDHTTYEEASFICSTLSATAYNYFKTSGYTEHNARIGTCTIYSFLLAMHLLFNKVGVYTIDDIFSVKDNTGSSLQIEIINNSTEHKYVGGGKNVVTTILKGIVDNKPNNIIKKDVTTIVSDNESSKKSAIETANNFTFVFNALK